MRDFKRLQNDPPQGIDGSPNPENIMLWNAIIFGPEDTPWDGGEAFITRVVRDNRSYACCAHDAPRQKLVCSRDSIGAQLPCLQGCASCAYRQGVNAECHACGASSGTLLLHAGTFKLTLQFSEEYPNKAPVVKFVSNIFHPNGACCCLLCALLTSRCLLCPLSLHM